MNPLARILAGLLALLALAGAFFFGLIVLALAVGLGLLAWLVLTLRVWWLRRRGGKGGGKPAGGGSGAGTDARPGEVIDGDYEVVSRREDP
jgi:hypothetical protein